METNNMKNRKILNLTQHMTTPEQARQGVFEPEDKDFVRKVLTFSGISDRASVNARALVLSDIALSNGCGHVMIGGAPYLMKPLEEAMDKISVNVLFSFSERVTTETIAEDGSVMKVSQFKHIGFI